MRAYVKRNNEWIPVVVVSFSRTPKGFPCIIFYNENDEERFLQWELVNLMKLGRKPTVADGKKEGDWNYK